MRRMADDVWLIQSKYMFVRVERPRGSKRFVMEYMEPPEYSDKLYYLYQFLKLVYLRK
mgnify:FL=1